MTRFLLLCLLVLSCGMLEAQNFSISQQGTIFTCSGNFWDSGIGALPYGPNESFTMTICPDSTQGNELTIEFANFALGAGDQLVIYDGPNTTSTVVGFFTTNPGTVISSSLNTSGCLTFQFTSNGIQENTGWRGLLSCRYKCQDVVAQITGTSIPTAPAPDTGYINLCPGDSVSFQAAGFYPQNDSAYHQSDATSTFEWNFGDGNTSNLQNPTHTYNSAGGWRTQLVITDSNGCISNTTEIKVRAAPEAFFVGTFPPQDSMCAGDTLQLTGTSQQQSGTFAPAGIVAGQTFLPDGNGASYETTITINSFLSTDSVQNATDIQEICANMEHSWLGDLEIELICPDNTTITLKSYPGGGGIFLGEPLDLNNTTPGNGWDYCWNASPTYGTMNAEAAGACPNCVMLTAPPSPSGGNTLPSGSYQPVDPLSDLVGCPLNGDWTIRVTDNIGQDNGYIFSWEIKFDTSLISTENFSVQTDSVAWTGPNIVQQVNDSTVLVVPNDTGLTSYTFTTYNEYGCTNDTTITITVIEGPQVDFVATPACDGDSVVFTDNTTTGVGVLTAWSWDFGDSTALDTNQNTQHQYDSAGFYSVVLEVTTSLGCTASDTLDSVQVYELPQAGFSFSNVCFNDTAFFTDTSSALNGTVNSWHWDFGDGDTSIVQNPAHLYTNDTLFVVTLAVETDLGCRDTITDTIQIYSLPISAFALHNACESDTVTFTDSSVSVNGSPIQIWQWDFENDGIFDSTGTVVSHAYGAAGTYAVLQLVTDSLGCSASSISGVVVHPRPIVNFSFDPVCLNDSMFFQDSSLVFSGAITEWSWDFGDGSVLDSAQNPVHLYADTGIYQVSLVVNTDSGCVNEEVYSEFVEVYKLPQVNFGFADVCFGDTMFFADSSSTLSGVVDQWMWSFGDGGGSGLQNPGHLYANDTLFEVQLVAISDLGCRDSISKWVNNYQLPVPGFNLHNACANDTVLFTDASTGPNGSPLVQWDWDFENDGIPDASGDTVEQAFSLFGTYTVWMEVTDSLGCSDTKTQQLVIHPRPTAQFSFTSVCAGDSMPFTDQSTVPTGAITGWSWDFGDASPLNTFSNPLHLYADTGLYQVSLHVTTDSGCISEQASVQQVEVYKLPNSGFSFQNVCFGDTMYFADTSGTQSGAVNQWYWDFGDGNTSTLANPAHLYANDTLFEVTLAVQSDLGCTDTISEIVDVYQLPVVAWTVQNICANDTAFFFDQSTGYQNNPIVAWNWDFGADGTVEETTQDANLQYANFGTEPIELTVTDSLNCTNSAIDSLVINPNPVADFISTNVCLGAPTLFFDSSTVATGAIAQYIWEYGDGTGPDTIYNPQYDYPSPGIYQISYIVVTDSGCADTTGGSVNIVVFPLPDPNFSFPLTCFNDSTQFTDLSTIASGSITDWLWVFGDNGATSALQHPAHLYSDTGLFEISLLATSDNGCTRMLTDTIDVQTLPEVSFSFTDHCLNDSVFFSNQSTIAEGSIQSYFWDFGFGDQATTSDPGHLFPSSGLLPVKLIATADSTQCQDSLTQQVEVYALPDVQFSLSNACEDSVVTFSNQTVSVNGSPLTAWRWDFENDGVVDDTNQNVQTPFATFGTYPIELAVFDSLGCRDSLVKPLVIHPNPVANFGFENVCFGLQTPFVDSTTLAAGNLTDWSWSLGDLNTNTTGPLIEHAYASAGDYFATLTVTSDSGCVDQSAMKTVTVFEKPLASFSALPVCEYDSVDFNNNSQINQPADFDSWIWSFGDGDSAFTIHADHEYATYGFYPVTLIAFSEDGCSDTIEQWMEIFSAPTAGFVTTNICEGDSFRFQNTSNNPNGSIDANLWKFLDPDTSDAEDPWYVFDTSGVFTIGLVVTTEHLCIDSIEREILVNPKPVAEFTYEPACAGSGMQFSNESYGIDGDRIDISRWNYADGSPIEVKFNPTHVFEEGGFYDVDLEVISEKGCSDSATVNVQVYDIPDVAFQAYPDAGCANLPVTLENESTFEGGGPLTYSWRVGDDTLEYTSRDLDVVLTNRSNQVELVPVWLTVNSTLCSNTLKVDSAIQLLPKPTARFIAQPQQVSVYDGRVFLEDISLYGFNNTWDLGDGNFFYDELELEYQYLDAGDYPIQLAVENIFGCSDTTTVEVRIIPEVNYYLPNAFTPNGDGINDYFSGVGEAYEQDFEFRIFDRGGQLIYYSNQPDARWDGMVDGIPAQQGVYVYRVSFVDEVNKKEINLAGEVTLIRPRQ